MSDIVSTYINDTIATGNAHFEEENRYTEKKYDSKPRTYSSVVFEAIFIYIKRTAYVLQ